MDGQPSFGRWLRWRRRLLDLTQAALAQQIGCALVTVRKLESDERRPSMQVVARLAECLKVAPAERATFTTFARAEPYLAVSSATSQPSEASATRLPQFHTNLPSPLTRLLGRRHDVAAARGLLLRAEERLLTLVGPPGVGKTRLALQVAAELQAAFSDGVVFVALAPINDPLLVAAAIVRSVGVPERMGQPLAFHLIDVLRTRRTLLLLDNCEQVAAAAPLLADLLEACPLVKVLASSRVPLHLRGERLVPVPPLALPALTQPASVATLARAPAVRLFVERAQSALPAFALTAQNAPAVAAVCARLDGLPLAIELIAARIAFLSPAQMLERLQEANPTSTLELLTGGPHDLPLRHRTLRNAIAWSYDLMETREQQLFRRMGVFVGGCSLPAVEAVCSVEHDGEAGSGQALSRPVLEDLASLIDKGLVRRVELPDREPRIEMLETIRAYALERLAHAGEMHTLYGRHAAYYLALAEMVEPLLESAEASVWAQTLGYEHDNLRVALERSRTTPMGTDLGVRLAGALHPYWVVHGPRSEGYQWLQVALEQGGAASPARAKALLAAGDLGWMQRAPGWSRALLEESLALYRELDDAMGAAQALGLLAVTAREQGDYGRAEGYLAESLMLAREHESVWGIARVLLEQGRVAQDQGEWERAVPLLEEALTLFRSTEDRWAVAEALLQLGRATHDQTLLEESMALFRSLDNLDGVAQALLAMGNMAHTQGDTMRAMKSYQQSLVINRQHGNKLWISDCLVAMAGVFGTNGWAHSAARLLGSAETMRHALATPLPPAARVLYEASVAMARACLGEAALAKEWEMGQAMSLEQAITEALVEGELLPASAS